MTMEERIINGLDEPPAGYKLIDSEIVEMTLDEMLSTGQITQEEYEKIITSENVNELQRRLAELQKDEIKSQAEVDEDFAAERKVELKALLAVKAARLAVYSCMAGVKRVK
jgi:membrane peptidoglycan carboxypeptidase